MHLYSSISFSRVLFFSSDAFLFLLFPFLFYLSPKIWFYIFTEHGEGLQVLHYEVGQKYDPHYDSFHDEFNTKNGGQRIATLLMYL